MLVWLAALIAVFAAGGETQASVEGTWKIREPLEIEVAGETCAVRRGIAVLDQTGATMSGRYEAEVACWSPYAPRADWEPRRGEILGTIDGTTFRARLFVGDPFPIHLEGDISGGSIRGKFRMGDVLDGSWSAARLP